jgi:hypothetical protein
MVTTEQIRKWFHSGVVLNKLDGRQVAIRFLKAGGVVITVKEADDA